MADAYDAPGVVKPFGIFSSAAWAPEGATLFISGHVAQDAQGRTVGKGDMRAQTRQCLANIRDVLAAAGGALSDIAKVSVFVTDISKIKEIHEVRAEFFTRPYPASTLVGVARLINPDWLIEIEATAVIPLSRVQRPATRVS
ncbi:MAG: RidA family protein [SAR202 cluster bacterium]|nr:RidA family protein [SAR202 cluster bacterium]